jgi:hypothetical protein
LQTVSLGRLHAGGGLSFRLVEHSDSESIPTPPSNMTANLCIVRPSMPKSRPQELYDKAEEERQRCRHWLLPFLRDNQPKFLSKAELRDAATRELKVSKNSFDCAWIEAIEQTGRHDWYEPLRRRLRVKS